MPRALPILLLAGLAAPAGATLVEPPAVPLPPDGGSTVLARVDQATLSADGEQRTRWYRLVRAGRAGFGEEPRLRFLGEGSQVRVPLARVWRGGTARTVPWSLEPVGGEPGARVEQQVHLELGEVRPGDLLEVVLERRVRSALGGLDFAPSHSFGGPRPVGREVFEVRVPDGVELRYLARGLGARSAPEVSVQDGRRVYRWKVDRPRAAPELPGRRPYVRATRLRSWREVSDWYAPRLALRRRASPSVRARARELTRDVGDDHGRLARLLTHVAGELAYHHRTNGTEADLCGRPAEVVLRTGRGNCVDKANLLAAMLGELGVSASPVLTSDSRSRPLDPEVPSFFPGDHALLRVNLGGRDVFCDPTEAGYRPGSLPPRLRRRVVWDPATGEFLATPGAAQHEDELVRSFEGRLGEGGRLQGRLEIQLGGEPEARARSRLRRSPTDPRLEGLLLPPGARVLDRSPANPADLGRPLRLTYLLEWTVPRLPDGRLLLRPPFPAPGEKATSRRRRGEQAVRVLDRARVLLPEGLRPSELPASRRAGSGASRYQAAWIQGPDGLRFTGDYQRRGPEVDPEVAALRREISGTTLALVPDR